jgi:hypothetical protein
VSGFQSLYLLSQEETEELLELEPDFIVSDSYFKDEQYELIKERYEGCNEELHVTGLSTQFEAVVPYTDSVWCTFLRRIA